jgi:hypothetical protein
MEAIVAVGCEYSGTSIGNPNSDCMCVRPVGSGSAVPPARGAHRKPGQQDRTRTAAGQLPLDTRKGILVD